MLAGWCGAAFLVHTAYTLAAHSYGERPIAAVLYVLGLAAMFPLHGSTRGPWLLALAFGLCWAVFVEGLRFFVVRDEASPLVPTLLALPLVALVVRRFSVDAGDAAFARRRRWVVPVTLALGAPPLFVGLLGARHADPVPYERAIEVLGFTIDTMLPPAELPFARSHHARLDWASFQSARSEVTAEVRGEVERTCGPLAPDGDERATCAYEHLETRLEELRQRRRFFASPRSCRPCPWRLRCSLRGVDGGKPPGYTLGPRSERWLNEFCRYKEPTIRRARRRARTPARSRAAPTSAGPRFLVARHARHARAEREDGVGFPARRLARATATVAVAPAGFAPVTQLEHARLGIITPEMRRVAEREPHLTAEQVRDEVAAGRMIIPANTVHLRLQARPDGDRPGEPDQDQRQHGRLAGLVAAPTKKSRS